MTAYELAASSQGGCFATAAVIAPQQSYACGRPAPRGALLREATRTRRPHRLHPTFARRRAAGLPWGTLRTAAAPPACSRGRRACRHRSAACACLCGASACARWEPPAHPSHPSSPARYGRGSCGEQRRPLHMTTPSICTLERPAGAVEALASEAGPTPGRLTVLVRVPAPLDRVLERDGRDVADAHVHAGLHGHAQQVDDMAAVALVLQAKAGSARARGAGAAMSRVRRRPPAPQRVGGALRAAGTQHRHASVGLCACARAHCTRQLFDSRVAHGGQACLDRVHVRAPRRAACGAAAAVGARRTCSSSPSAAFRWFCSELSAPCRAAHSCGISIAAAARRPADLGAGRGRHALQLAEARLCTRVR